jgi:hypothetical protein
MKIKKQIRITYLATLDTDNIEEDINNGMSDIALVMKELKKKGTESHSYVRDYEVESVEDIEEA